MRPYVALQAGRARIRKGPYVTISDFTGRSRQHRRGTIWDRKWFNKPAAAVLGRHRMRPYVASQAGRGSIEGDHMGP